LPASIAAVFTLLHLKRIVPYEGMTLCVAEQYGNILSLTRVMAKSTSYSNELNVLLPETNGYI
jgi:hypothetical protein